MMMKADEVRGRTPNFDVSIAASPSAADQRAAGLSHSENSACTWSVVSLRKPASFEPYIASWEALAADAAEPNPFFEHWMLLPALRLYDTSQEVEVAMVIQTSGDGSRRVVGVFPLQRPRRFRGLPVRAAVLWDHPHCFLCTPLMARGSEAACWRALLAWERASAHRDRLIELQTISADGPVFRSFLEVAGTQQLPVHLSGLYTRPVLEVGPNAASYLADSMPKSDLQNYDRKRRRLSESGILQMSTLTQSDNVDAWIEQFLHLEASGWKGRTGTAMACNDADRQFLSEIAHEGFRRQRLKMVTMSLDGQAIASEFDIAAGEGVFSLKIAYDEQHARFSPGMVLAIEVIRHVHEQTQIRWMDSCAAPGAHPLNRLWGQRRNIVSIVCPTGRPFSHLLVSLMLLARYLQRLLPSRSKTPDPDPT